MKVANAWRALIRLRGRQQALDRFIRMREAEGWRRRAFESPPMTPEEVREFQAAKAAVRRRDEAVRG